MPGRSSTSAFRTRTLQALVVASVAALLGAQPAVAHHDLFRRVSQGDIHGNGAVDAFFRGASSDGKRVWFHSAEQLTGGDTDSYQDVYERYGGQTRLISDGAINGNGAFAATWLGASDSGNRVFFETDEQLVAGDTDAVADIYQRSGGVTILISTAPGNGNVNQASEFQFVSNDGARVLFETLAQIGADDDDNSRDLFERFNGVTTQISLGPNGGNGAFSSEFVGASGDGSRIWFKTQEALVSSDTDVSVDVYERSNGQTFRISRGVINGNQPKPATFLAASANGARVFFYTDEKLHGSDTDSSRDIYAFNTANGSIDLISAGAINGNFIFSSLFQGSSADGSRVFFTTQERLVSGDTDERMDLYERHAGATTHVSAGAVNGNDNYDVLYRGASADGGKVFFTSQEQLIGADHDIVIDLYERIGATLQRVSASSTAGNGPHNAAMGCFSSDAARVFFTTREALVGDDTDTNVDIYERASGSTFKVTTGNAAFDASVEGCTSDGRAIFFETSEKILSGDNDGVIDVYGAYLDT